MVEDPGDPAEPISAVVVAGGRSVRLGQDKRRLRLWGDDGPMLLEQVVAVMAGLCDEVIVVLNDPEQWNHLPARLVADLIPDGGALGGIYSGLAAITTPWACVVAGDMPFLNRDLLAWMMAQPRTYDVLVPSAPAAQTRNRLGLQTMHALYRRTCRDTMRRELDAGHRQIAGLYTHLRVEVIADEDVRRFDPAGVAFMNVNTPAELDAASRLIGGRPGT